jgi:phosphohistidine phosphatase
MVSCAAGLFEGLGRYRVCNKSGNPDFKGFIPRSVHERHGTANFFRMFLLVVRHADAGDSEEFAKTGMRDELRPLSDKGRRQMKKVARALKLLVPECDLLATSPYVRAVETTESLRSAYPGTNCETTATLEPDEPPESAAKWLNEKRKLRFAAVVGHEPHLGNFVGWLLSGDDDGGIELKKAGAALLEFEGSIQKGEGRLLWLMGPKELDLIRKSR